MDVSRLAELKTEFEAGQFTAHPVSATMFAAAQPDDVGLYLGILLPRQHRLLRDRPTFWSPLLEPGCFHCFHADGGTTAHVDLFEELGERALRLLDDTEFSHERYVWPADGRPTGFGSQWLAEVFMAAWSGEVDGLAAPRRRLIVEPESPDTIIAVDYHPDMDADPEIVSPPVSVPGLPQMGPKRLAGARSPFAHRFYATLETNVFRASALVLGHAVRELTRGCNATGKTSEANAPDESGSPELRIDLETHAILYERTLSPRTSR